MSDDPTTAADALTRVTDDTEAAAVERLAVDWAGDALVAGRTFDEVTAELLDRDWSADEAERIVELARVETRSARGVVTRDDVVGRLNRQRRHDTRGLAVAFRAGIFNLLAFNAAIRTFRWLKWVARRRQG